MGKRRREHRQRSRSRERNKRSKRDNGSCSCSSRSRCRHDGTKRGERNRHGRHKSPASCRCNTYETKVSTSTSRTGTWVALHSRHGSEERSSSGSAGSTALHHQRSHTPPSRSRGQLPCTSRGERSPLAVEVINDKGSPQHNTGERSPRQCTGERLPEINITGFVSNEVVLPEDTLQALGEKTQGNEKALELHPIIANRWKSILAKGLDKAEKASLLGKHQLPGNLAALNAPILNNEVLKAVSPNTQNKDKFLQNNQNQLGRGLTALAAGINILLSNNDIDKENKNSVLAFLSESGKILTDVHYNMSLTRRALITPTVNKTIGDISKTTPIEDLLFGSDLNEKIKVAKAIEKSVGDIRQKPETLTRTVRKIGTTETGTSVGSFRKNLNFRGPSGFRREPRQQRGRLLQQPRKKANYLPR